MGRPDFSEPWLEKAKTCHNQTFLLARADELID